MLATISLTALAALAAVVVIALVWALGSVTHSLTYSWKNGNNTVTAVASQTAEKEVNTSLALTASQANKEFDIAFTNATLHELFILPTLDCHMYVNDVSGGSPTDTIALKAGIPFTWVKNSGVPYPFTGTGGTHAVTKFYFTNDIASAATVDVRALIDLP